MNKKLRFGLLIILILGLQAVIGVVFIKPYIFTWGATDQEISMSMPGDHLVPFISSTRAITINAPISDVWDWIIQLGADRGGFYRTGLLKNHSDINIVKLIESKRNLKTWKWGE